ncbi:Rhomboid family protein [Paenibacillus darwinianus]|uniref:Rhomboid family protein n=1 Tax=Paenibacillus darwinianus TaxID=1380763 RepID=A0A9W5W6Z1_9BACL|nr:rhomboid family intramembrane serine protease [Paenibacillus darwinianus]EXX87017.1 Rhomboid family protein [Paenibacillus darwinianus]EXX87171.1 Rhomboid family protein [Paenibacillus darwinianus]EXX87244.1 Rhomboid family protein [Paenibacillus darwinianus]
MIFLRYESFRSYVRLYPVTAVILAVNLLVFIADWLLPGQPLTIRGMFSQQPLVDRYGLAEPWRYVTSITLHAGWQHLLFNSFSILVFAPPLERVLGHVRYLLFYLLAGILGNAVSAVVYAGSVHLSVGASGAIYGVFGAYLFLAVFRKYAMDEASRKTIYMILIFGLIYSILSPNINIWAHIGGGISGFAMMGMFVRARKRS